MNKVDKILQIGILSFKLLSNTVFYYIACYFTYIIAIDMNENKIRKLRQKTNYEGNSKYQMTVLNYHRTNQGKYRICERTFTLFPNGVYRIWIRFLRDVIIPNSNLQILLTVNPQPRNYILTQPAIKGNLSAN